MHDVFTLTVVSPNNHLLNTLLMKLSASVFGTSEMSLRLPNWLAFLGFMYAVYLMIRRLSPWIALSAFALITCNPYMLDSFATARGNGLSYFFMTYALYYLVGYTKTTRVQDYRTGLILAFLAVLSHYAMIYFLVSMMIVVNIWLKLENYYRKEDKIPLGKTFLLINIENLIVGVMLAAIMIVPVGKMIHANQFFYGGETGFWHDTVGTLIETFFYGAPYAHALTWLLQLIIIIVVIYGILYISFTLYVRMHYMETANHELLIIFLVLVTAIVVNLAQFHILGTKLLIRRYGLLYAPLFLLCLACIVNQLDLMANIRKLTTSFFYILALAFMLHTFWCYSPDTYLDWPYERDTKQMVTDLSREVEKSGSPPSVTLGITWLFEPTVNYYRLTRGLTWLNPVTRNGPSIAADYYYVMRDDLGRIPMAGAKPDLFIVTPEAIGVQLLRSR